MDNQTLYIRVINKDGSLIKVNESEYLECASLVYESQLSSYDLLTKTDSKIMEDKVGALQLKTGLDSEDFTIAQLQPNVLPHCAIIQNIQSIKISNQHGTKPLLDILGKDIPSEDKALLFARNMQMKDSDGYVADIIIFND